MSDYLIRGFRAQINTAMELVLRSAVCDVMRIFENSLREHQTELAQKGEEVALLKIKLQTAEVKLRELVCAGDSGAETSKTEVVVNSYGETADVPEIDIEVPEDWCAPLGYETVTKQDDDVCPSVRLRPLLIPLCRIPVVKQEEAYHPINFPQQRESVRNFRRDSLLNMGHKQTQGRRLPKRTPGSCKQSKNDMKRLLLDIKYSDLSGGNGLRRRTNLTGKKQDNVVKSRRRDRKILATKSERFKQEMVENNGDKMYSCKFCEKVFDTAFGLSVHVRSHKKCRICMREFPFPSIRKNHEKYCSKRLLLDIKYSDLTDGKGLRRRTKLKGKKQDNVVKSFKQEMVEYNGDKQYSCKFCKKVFDTELGLSVHVQSHKRCRGCMKEFPFPSFRRTHEKHCSKLKMSSSQAAPHTNPPKPASCDEGEITLDSRKQVTFTSESSPLSDSHSETLSQEAEDTEKNTFACCSETFPSSCRLKEHICGPASEKCSPCSMSPNVTRMQQDQMNSTQTSGDRAWIVSLDNTEDKQQDLIPPS